MEMQIHFDTPPDREATAIPQNSRKRRRGHHASTTRVSRNGRYPYGFQWVNYAAANDSLTMNNTDPSSSNGPNQSNVDLPLTARPLVTLDSEVPRSSHIEGTFGQFSLNKAPLQTRQAISSHTHLKILRTAESPLSSDMGSSEAYSDGARFREQAFGGTFEGLDTSETILNSLQSDLYGSLGQFIITSLMLVAYKSI